MRKSPEHKGCLTLDDVHRDFVGLTGMRITRTQHRLIVYTFIKKTVKAILYEAAEVNFGSFVGLFRIKLSKPKMNKKSSMYVDWGTTRKKQKETGDMSIRIYHLNEHTKGVVARWYWNKGECRLPNKSIYGFTPSRTNKRDLAQIMLREVLTIDYKY